MWTHGPASTAISPRRLSPRTSWREWGLSLQVGRAPDHCSPAAAAVAFQDVGAVYVDDGGSTCARLAFRRPSGIQRLWWRLWAASQALVAPPPRRNGEW